MQRGRSERFNFTQEEKMTFLTILEKYKSAINDKRTSAVVLARKNKVWLVVANEYNSQMRSNRTRSAAQLKRLYHNLKNRLKSKLKAGQGMSDETLSTELDFLADPNMEGTGRYQNPSDETDQELNMFELMSGRNCKNENQINRAVKQEHMSDDGDEDDNPNGGDSSGESDVGDMSLNNKNGSDPNNVVDDKNRCPNYTLQEQHTLLKIIKKYKSIITDKRVSSIFLARKRKAWAVIANEFNAKFPINRNRNATQLKRLYGNLKNRLGIKTKVTQPIPHRQSLTNFHEDKELRELMNSFHKNLNPGAGTSGQAVPMTSESNLNPNLKQMERTSSQNYIAKDIQIDDPLRNDNSNPASDDSDDGEMSSDCENSSKLNRSNYTLQEKLQLLTIIKKHSSIINDTGTTRTIIAMKRKVWTTIKDEFNSQVSADRTRNAYQLKRLYQNLKTRLGIQPQVVPPIPDNGSVTESACDGVLLGLMEGIEQNQPPSNETERQFGNIIVEVEPDVSVMEGTNNKVADDTPENENPLSDSDLSIQSDSGDSYSDDETESKQNGENENHDEEQASANKSKKSLRHLKETYFKMKISNAKLQRKYITKISELELKILEQKMVMLKKGNLSIR